MLSIETGFLSRSQKVYKNHKDVFLMYKSVGKVLLPVLIQSDFDDLILIV